MRVKNDTCIKSYQLTNTMFLTNEEFGMLIRKLMIEDDEEGFRYDVDKDIKTEYINCEKTWLNEFEEAKKNNPILKQAYMILRGQTQKSRKAFEDLSVFGLQRGIPKKITKRKHTTLKEYNEQLKKENDILEAEKSKNEKRVKELIDERKHLADDILNDDFSIYNKGENER